MKLKNKRGAGILLPISALPSPYGIGTLGKSAYQFVDWLKEAGQTYWQVLPIGPTSYGDSPYQSFSAFAGNPYFIDLDTLIDEGLLRQSEVDAVDWGDHDADAAYGTIDYAKIFEARFDILKKAYARSKHKEKESYQKFLRRNTYWIDDYSMYMALKVHFGQKAWTEWDDEIRFREPEAMKKYSSLLADEIDFWKFLQYKFQKQWKKLRKYANKNGVKIIGDIPIYVAMDSADVWAHDRIFELDERKEPIHVAGVPPDCFSETGQRWGNPLYRWDVMEQDDFNWWRERMSANARFYDVIRIDHFLGIVRYYSIPASCESAMEGTWEKGPGRKLTNAISEAIGKDTQIIAEDLGLIVPEVRKLINKTGWPGMKILLFAFGDTSENEYLPHNFTHPNSVVYGGTHDNDTIVGYVETQTEQQLQYLYKYLNVKTRQEIPDAMIRAGYASTAYLAVFQMQDILKLGNEARMNTPSTLGGNWCYRCRETDLSLKRAKKLRHLATVYGRNPQKLRKWNSSKES